MKTFEIQTIAPPPQPRVTRSHSILLLIKRATATRDYRCIDGSQPLTEDEMPTSLYHRPVSHVRRLIARLRREGTSYESIARELNDAGVPNRGTGARWQAINVYETLNGPSPS